MNRDWALQRLSDKRTKEANDNLRQKWHKKTKQKTIQRSSVTDYKHNHFSAAFADSWGRDEKKGNAKFCFFFSTLQNVDIASRGSADRQIPADWIYFSFWCGTH